MSLFGGTEKRLQTEKAQLSAVITVLEDQIDRMADLLAESSGKFDLLLEAHSQLVKTHSEVVDELTALKNAREEVAAPTFAPFPLHVPEWEEDAAHQLETGLIDEDMYKEILKQADLEPNVELDQS